MEIDDDISKKRFSFLSLEIEDSKSETNKYTKSKQQLMAFTFALSQKELSEKEIDTLYMTSLKEEYSREIFCFFPDCGTCLIRIFKDTKLVGVSKWYLSETGKLNFHNFGIGCQCGMGTPFILGPASNDKYAYHALLNFVVETAKTAPPMFVGYLDGYLYDIFKYHENEIRDNNCTYYGSVQVQGFKQRHKNLKKQVKHFHKNGGQVHVLEGPCTPELAKQFTYCLKSTYKRRSAGESCSVEDKYTNCLSYEFFTKAKHVVHFYTTFDDEVHGCQTFFVHKTYLELSDGGFSDKNNYHSYETIVQKVVEYADEKGLECIGYGAAWPHVKSKMRFTQTDISQKLYTVVFNEKQDKAIGDEKAKDKGVCPF